MNKESNNFFMFYLYFDDLIYAGNCIKILIDFKKIIMKEYEISDLRVMRYFFFHSSEAKER